MALVEHVVTNESLNTTVANLSCQHDRLTWETDLSACLWDIVLIRQGRPAPSGWRHIPWSGLSQTHPRFLIPFHEYLGLPPSLGAPPPRLMLPHILGRHPLTQIIHTSNPVWTCASQRTQTNPSFTQKTTELSSLSGYTGSKCRFVMFCLQFKIQNSLKLPRFVFTLLKAIGFLWVFHLVKHLVTKSLMCLVRGVFF